MSNLQQRIAGLVSRLGLSQAAQFLEALTTDARERGYRLRYAQAAEAHLVLFVMRTERLGRTMAEGRVFVAAHPELDGPVFS